MPHFDIVKKTESSNSFRVASIMGKFDLQSGEVVEKFSGNIDIENLDWQVGMIVGNSGTGKTSILNNLYQDCLTEYNFDKTSIIEDMPKGASVDSITRMFNSVGFSSPPSWLKPYSVLSNGEKMRVDLAYSLLEGKEVIAFDEFTSVVDRNVAKITSNAVQKAIRKTDKKFIAVGCHFDVIDWLLPDWVFNTNDMSFYTTSKKKDQTLTSEYMKQKINKTIGICLVNTII